MSASVADYTELLQNLLPQGPAWNRSAGSALTRLLTGLARELARLDARAEQLIAEANPRTTREMLDTRYTEAGLPSPCAGRPTLREQQRAEILYRWAAIGGASLEYWSRIITVLGYPVSIEESHPFRVGEGAVGDPIAGSEWAYWWQVNALDAAYQHFAVGDSTVGEPLQLWGNNTLTCLLEYLKPAHTALLLNYVATPGELEEATTFDAGPTWSGTLTNYTVASGELHYSGPYLPFAALDPTGPWQQPALPAVYVTPSIDVGSSKTCQLRTTIEAEGDALIEWAASADGVAFGPWRPASTMQRGRVFQVRVTVTGSTQCLTAFSVQLFTFPS